MGYCSHNSRKIDSLTASKEGLEKRQAGCVTLKEQAESIKEMFSSFADSIRSIGYYLSFVNINNDTFDKGECETNAKSIDNVIEEIETYIASLDSAYDSYQELIDTYAANIRNMPSLCDNCQAAALAAQQQSSTTTSTTTTTTSASSSSRSNRSNRGRTANIYSTNLVR